jgi:hypothetical protein
MQIYPDIYDRESLLRGVKSVNTELELQSFFECNKGLFALFLDQMPAMFS